MTRRLVLVLAAAAPLFVAAVSSAQGLSSLDSLCRIHGVNREDEILKIGKAYRDAVDAGISEEEIHPFVEDILRHKLGCGQMVRVLEATATLRREGLPYFVVLSKVREGVAKAAPPALVVEAAESKLRTLSESRDVLKSLESLGFRVLDFQNAAVVVSSYLERGYTAQDLVSRIGKRGIEGAGFAALSGVLEKPVKTRER